LVEVIYSNRTCRSPVAAYNWKRKLLCSLTASHLVQR